MFRYRALFRAAIAACIAVAASAPFAHAQPTRSPDAVSGVQAVQFNRLPGYNRAQTEIANKIARKFAAAGYGRVHQIAAVSVAIRESTLNPKAHNRGCKCFGLFQLNRGNGLGTGHSKANLTNPDYNIRLIIGEADRFKSFRQAKTINAAVSAFVRHVTRPARKKSVINATIKTARMVERSASSSELSASAASVKQ